MANVVEKTTLIPSYSVNTPDYPTNDYLINPAGLAALDAAAIPIKYRKLISGDTDCGEMTQGEKDAVDAAEPPVVPVPIFIAVLDDPTSTAVDAPEGSVIVFEGRHFHKDDDGSSTNVSPRDPLTVDVGQAGGSLLSLIEYTTDPTTPVTGDTWIRNTSGTRRLVFYDGTTKHAVVLTAE